MENNITGTTALIIVDVQNDFLPGGPLAVTNGDEIIPYINSIMENYQHVFATLDWHPKNHVSFYTTHEGHKIFDVIDNQGQDQILWDVHCVQDTPGAEYPKSFRSDLVHQWVYKGTNPNTECYSGFFDSFKNPSDLDERLKKEGIDTLHVCGLATDFCVNHTILDALELGYKTYFLSKGVRPINLKPGDADRALANMQAKGAIII